MFTHKADEVANPANIEQLAENIIGSMREPGMFTHTADQTANATNIEQLAQNIIGNMREAGMFTIYGRPNCKRSKY